MSIVTFWNSGRNQTGKTLSIAAIATYLAIEHNYRVLVVSTGYNDFNLDNCFWMPRKVKKNLGLFGPNTNIAMEEGIAGLTRIMKSNKLSPDIITNYTKIIFKDRLEILPTYKGNPTEYGEMKKYFPEIIELANNYYDLVLVDLDKDIEEDTKQEILKRSNLIVITLNQGLSTINNFIEQREKNPLLNSQKNLILIGRYDKYSKYNIKNISRYLKEKNKVSTIPYNTLFFEACEEAGVPDLFLKVRNIGEEDRNGFFVSEIRRTVDNIIYRLRDLSMKI